MKEDEGEGKKKRISVCAAFVCLFFLHNGFLKGDQPESVPFYHSTFSNFSEYLLLLLCACGFKNKLQV